MKISIEYILTSHTELSAQTFGVIKLTVAQIRNRQNMVALAKELAIADKLVGTIAKVSFAVSMSNEAFNAAFGGTWFDKDNGKIYFNENGKTKKS